jgi:hypothetical protein
MEWFWMAVFGLAGLLLANCPECFVRNNGDARQYAVAVRSRQAIGQALLVVAGLILLTQLGRR